MNIVRYKANELPPPTEEELAGLMALDEKILSGEIEVDCSDMPEMDEFDFKYSVSFAEVKAMTDSERHELGRKIQAVKDADRAALKARQEFEAAIAKHRQLAHQT